MRAVRKQAARNCANEHRRRECTCVMRHHHDGKTNQTFQTQAASTARGGRRTSDGTCAAAQARLKASSTGNWHAANGETVSMHQDGMSRDANKEATRLDAQAERNT